ncbi:MAG: fibronectin type III domain-containing protein [Actinobacteria bacterium]|nr:fibronectin type III domain-containing protein [Actinomycetota bacterium]
MRERRLLVAVVVTVVLATSSVAFGAFTSAHTASTTLGTDVLTAPTSPATAHGPCTAVAASIVVSWTATASTWADGYEILESPVAEGPFTHVAAVDGVGTTNYTVTGLSFGTTYHYVVKARKANWRSSPTAVVSHTTLSALCL